jgi:hypothetical protein
LTSLFDHSLFDQPAAGRAAGRAHFGSTGCWRLVKQARPGACSLLAAEARCCRGRERAGPLQAGQNTMRVKQAVVKNRAIAGGSAGGPDSDDSDALRFACLR